jgi:DNA topoisomerase-1
MGKRKSLVIVESPTKAKTINKYLGNEYSVKSSMGHLIDLPKSRLAVDVDNDFKPDYITIRGRGKILSELKKEAQKTDQIYLAADSDREGEAISFHIKNALEKANPNAEIKRIVFNEITDMAIKESIGHSRNIDMTLVNAQKARRILDRIVGYSLSPLLWEKIKKGLSAGRVQSVALRVICEREEEIEKFTPEEFWTIEAEFIKGKKQFGAKLVLMDGEKVRIGSEQEANTILNRVKDEVFTVQRIEESERRRKAPPPFTTSKMQQAAGSRLGFPARKTMMVAQQLYEGIDIEGGPVGLITYMRTDSTRVSAQAQEEAARYVRETFSEKYIPDKPHVYRNKGGAQDAHEAIRPTSVFREPSQMKEFLSRDQLRLYTLIWEQFVASQMTAAVFKQVKVDITADGGVFRTNGQKVLFDGFLKVYRGNGTDKEKVLPALSEGEQLQPLSVDKEVHYTEPPPRFTDSTLVRFLEESGIGRPSTYAPIITTLISRYYIVREKRQFKPTFLGSLTNDLMVKSFPDLLSIQFSSNMEARLDEVADGKLDWVQLLKDFYHPFIQSVEEAQQKLESYKGITDEETDHTCEKCGRPMIKKLGKYGYFLACSGFPECRNTMALPYGKCPRDDCDGFVVERKTKKKRSFYGCSRYPDCDFMTWDKPSDNPCPQCGSIMVEKNLQGVKKLVCQRESCGHSIETTDEKKEKVLVKT